MTFTYTDREGDRLTIGPDNVEPGAAAFVSSDTGAFVAVADLPSIVAELYKAAGQEPPILLPRLDWRGSDRQAFVFNGVSVVRTGKTINILGRNWHATTARGVACVLAEMADAADAEPDPEKLAALTKVVTDADPWLPGNTAEAVARAVLAAGYTRSES